MSKRLKTKIFLILIVFFSFIIRSFQLATIPPSLSWDEASLGYNAYTISSSLRDEHNELLPLARFIAFGDYKPPGYIYAAVPFVKIFGLNEISVRLPSVLSGVMMVFITYLLVFEIFRIRKFALLAAFMTGISPWSIFLSRAAYEANLAAVFNLTGIYFFYLFFRKKWAIIVSVIFFAFSFYTFNANRIIAPLLFIFLSSFYYKKVILNKKYYFISLLMAVIMFLPSINYMMSKESKLRFQEVSIFNNLGPIKVSNARISRSGNSLISRIFFNRRVLFAMDYLKHYSDNFSLRFLFTHGDVNPRLAVQSMGQLYVWDLFFILSAIFFIIKKNNKSFIPIIVWILIAPIPAGTARETAHALRILSILPAYQILIAYGLYQLIRWWRCGFSRSTSSRSHLVTPGRWPNGLSCKELLPGGRKKIITAIICLLLSVNLYYYLHDYYIHYPSDWSGEWQYGTKEMVQYVQKNQDKYDAIFVSNSIGRPYIFFAFYQKYSLNKFLSEKNENRDWFGFSTVNSLGKINFEFTDLNTAPGKVLLVNSSDDKPDNFKILNKITNLKGDTVFSIFDNL